MKKKKSEQSCCTWQEEGTVALAAKLAPELPDGTIICLFGDLAAGKTAFVRGVAQGCGCVGEQVSSPTFSYLNIYQGERTLFHFDLYRLEGEEQFLAMGFEEFFGSEGITCVEWSERITSLLGDGMDVLMLEMMQQDGGRLLTFTGAWPEIS